MNTTWINQPYLIYCLLHCYIRCIDELQSPVVDVSDAHFLSLSIFLFDLFIDNSCDEFIIDFIGAWSLRSVECDICWGSDCTQLPDLLLQFILEFVYQLIILFFIDIYSLARTLEVRSDLLCDETSEHSSSKLNLNCFFQS